MSDYIPSTARTEFELSLIEISEVLPAVGDDKDVDPTLKNYVLGASLLFLHAKIENYIRDLFIGIAQELCRGTADPCEIPISLLGWIFLSNGHFELSRNFVARNDESLFIKATGQHLADDLLTHRSDYLKIERFRGFDDKAYPSVKNLKRMFKRIGLDDLFLKLNRRLARNVELDFESLNNLRGQLAHSGISGSIGYSDVIDKLVGFTTIIGAIDKETYEHLLTVCASPVWKS